jgi:hypothetical protein
VPLEVVCEANIREWMQAHEGAAHADDPAASKISSTVIHGLPSPARDSKLAGWREPSPLGIMQRSRRRGHQYGDRVRTDEVVWHTCSNSLLLPRLTLEYRELSIGTNIAQHRTDSGGKDNFGRW